MDNPFSVTLPKPPAEPPEYLPFTLPRNSTIAYASPTKRKRRVEPNQTRQQRPKQTEVASSELLLYNVLPQSDFMDFSIEKECSFPDFDNPNIVEAHECRLEERPEESMTPAARSYALFMEGIRLGSSKMLQISHDIFVGQGWDSERGMATQNWYHLQRTQSGDEILLGCCCPTAITLQDCVHMKLMSDFGTVMFPNDGALGELSDIVCFSVDPIGGEEVDYLYRFSVALTSQSSSLKSRTIVTYQSSFESECEGVFKCQSDQRVQNCGHISAVRNHPYVKESCLSGMVEDGDECSDTQVSEGEIVAREPAFRGAFQAVSHLRVPYPSWATLPDEPQYQTPPPLTLPLPPLLLNHDSSCSCRGHTHDARIAYNSSLPTLRKACIIYGLFTSYSAEIELQYCPGSADRGTPYHFIGPDPQELGIFNLNNASLFTHELLNGYTSAFSCSETPFISWTTQISRFYHTHASPHPFIFEEGFRTAWFAFVNLQIKDGDMACMLCGPNPSVTIWDGVTLSFSRKHLQSSIRPPTSTDERSPSHNRKYVSAQQLITNATLRRSLMKVVSSSQLGSIHKLLTKASDFKPKEKDQTALSTLVQSIPDLEAELAEINLSLAQLYMRIFGLQALVLGPPSAAYIAFFKQIAADESTLQTANQAALNLLKELLSSPDTIAATKIIQIPAVHAVLEETRRNSKGPIPGDLVGTLKWIYEVSNTNLSRILSNGNVEASDALSIPEVDWRQSGCCYSMPQIRYRPTYPSLAHDVKKESGGSRGSKCSKYYSQYGKQRLTGGIMGVWCTHSICYGFHFIPSGEGRNDVFSAIYTRWPTAPKRVIYDFACALGPYCLTREGQFFANTSFNIDTFHAKGHTKCSPAAFLKTYANLDPRLIHINSSAAECGNSGIRRIRKSVSYMTQERAFVYTRVFLSIWNRQRIRKLKERSV